MNKTGLHGDYQIVLTYFPFGSVASDPGDPAADIFSAIQLQLGLRLQAERGTVAVVKIESIEKVPTRN